MIAEEYNYNYLPDVSIPKGMTISLILSSMKSSIIPFQSARSQAGLIKPLNENKLTQIFVEQVDVQLRNKNLAIGVKNQYNDIFLGTSGIPDFYFHAVEEGRTSVPLFIVESKRLPIPQGIETEYVIGNKENGAIERFKIGKHGKGLDECGVLGFIETGTFDEWHKKINSWIDDLANKSSDWFKDEVLNTVDSAIEFNYLDSLTHRSGQNKIKLHHLWLN